MRSRVGRDLSAFDVSAHARNCSDKLFSAFYSDIITHNINILLDFHGRGAYSIIEAIFLG